MRLTFIASIIVLLSCNGPLPSNPIRANQTFTYEEGILWWDSLSRHSDQLSLTTFGETDAGYPLHVAILSGDKMELASLKASSKTIILINNAIHPGEPDGVDASMALFRDLISNDSAELLENVVLVCIPFYNIGGTFNRNNASRANQNGPIEYGFRGNAQNLDLNRDFVKCDSKNALSFAQLIQIVDPDIYVETHVSNGADYRYNMTYLSSQIDKMGYGLDKFTNEEMLPALKASMKLKEQEMIPYVNVHGTALGNSYDAFYDSPRFSTGLMALHQVIGFITETHMLKPYDIRVQATKSFLESILDFAVERGLEIQNTRSEAKEKVAMTTSFPLQWEKDSNRYDSFLFKGYEHAYKKSEVTGAQRLYYDRSKPFTRQMKFYGYMTPHNFRDKPKAYVLRKGYSNIQEILKANGVSMTTVNKDRSNVKSKEMELVSYVITSFETSPRPFEKHYYHYNTKFIRDTIKLNLNAGDMIIEMGTDKDRFLMEMFEPDGDDSYFNWNFFDAHLQQKEWYSSYVFEDLAAEYLANDPQLNSQFNIVKDSMSEPEQLYWIYKHSEHYEHAHMRLPIYRME